MERLSLSVLIVLGNLAILAGCAYVVFWMGHSGWWFLVAAIFMFGTKDKCDCDE